MEGVHTLCQQPRRLQEIVDQHRHVDIQLEISLARGDADGRIIAHDLHGHHGNGLALGRIDLSGHDGRTRFIFRYCELSKAQPRAGSQPADIIGDLH